ncbi:MAG TPA: TetR/AcrR family transcriptional regulator [Thermoanaerobaculia bacterium]
MPRIKTQDKEQAILEAAAGVFSGKQFHEVLIDEVAARAHVGKGTIYRYFQTKEDLFFATILHSFDELSAALAVSLERETSPKRRLERIAREVLSFSWERQDLFALLLSDERRFRERDEELQKRRETISRLAQEAILEGIRRREFRGIDARVGAELFRGMIRAANFLRRREETLEELVSEIVGIFTRGIEREGR